MRLKNATLRASGPFVISGIIVLLVVVFVVTWVFRSEPHRLRIVPVHIANPPVSSLRVVMDNNYPPYVFLDEKNKAQGILVDQWEKLMGIKVELTAIPWEDAQGGMKAGKYDVIDTIFQTKERSKIYEFTAPYARIDVPIFFQNNISGIAGVKNLAGFRVAVKSGDANVDFLRNEGVTNLAYYSSYEEVVKSAARKKESVFVMDQPPAFYFLYKYGIQDQFNRSLPFYSGAFHRAVRKGDKALLSLVEHGFASIRDVEYEKIDKRWFGIRQGVTWKHYLPYLGAGAMIVLVIMLTLIVLNAILKNRVRQRTKELEEEIAEHRKTEDALRDSEERYRELVEHANSIILRMDSGGTITFINDFAQRFFGFTQEELLGRNVVGTIVPVKATDGTDMATVLCDIELHPERYGTNENENVRKDGTRCWVAWTNKGILDEQGRCEAVLCVGTDITERKRAEEALRGNEAKQRAMEANISDVIAIVDQNGINRYKSPNIEKWFGWRPEDVVGVPTWENIYPDDLEHIRKFFGGILREQNATGTGECRYRCKDGSYKWIEVTAVNLLHDPDIRGVLLNYHCINERKRAEEEKAKLEGQFHQAQKMESVGRLAGGVAHDFNNMLQVILGNVGVALEEIPPSSPVRENLEEIQKAAQRSTDLTRQLLAFARQQTIAPKVLDLNDAVEGLLKMMRRLIGEDIDLTWLPAPDLGLIKVDPTQIDQILANLCVNARDAIGGVGKVSVETVNSVFDKAYCADHPGFVPGEYVLLTVSDNGCGMDKQMQAHIFEPFFTTKSVGKGTGLGLATVYGQSTRPLWKS